MAVLEEVGLGLDAYNPTSVEAFNEFKGDPNKKAGAIKTISGDLINNSNIDMGPPRKDSKGNPIKYKEYDVNPAPKWEVKEVKKGWQ